MQDMIQKILRYKDTLLSVVLFAVIASFFFVHTEYAFDSTSGPMEASGALMFRSTDKITQELNVRKNMLLTKISIQFGTYARENKGTLHVQLYEDKKIVEDWEVSTSQLADNDYHGFELDEPLKIDPASPYRICLFEEHQGDNGIAVWTSSEKNKPCYRNGILLNRRSICYQVDQTDIALKNKVSVIAFVIALVSAILILLKIDEKIIMCGIFVTLGCIYMWLCTPGMAPDESNHFYRAFEISCGNLLSRVMRQDGVGGNYLPLALEEYEDPDVELDWDKTGEITFSNTALYAPVSYLPQAVGIKVARTFTDNVSKIFYAGKAGNFLASVLLCIWAIFRMPFGKKILFMVMTFPMTLQEMVSMSTDGFTTSLCLAFTAYILYLSYNNSDRIRKRDICIAALLSLAISLCKIVYVVLVLLIVIIPNKKIGEGKKWILFKLGIPAVAVTANMIWLKISSGYLIEFQPGVSSDKQIQYVLSNMGDFYTITVRSIIEYGNSWIQSMFGSSMGALDITISSIVWICFLILFLYETCNCKRLKINPHRWDQTVMALIFLGGAALICASLYVQWTPWKSELINGIQGRYFIPLIIFPALFVMYSNDKTKKYVRYIITYKETGKYYYMILLTLNGITILDMIRYDLNN